MKTVKKFSAYNVVDCCNFVMFLFVQCACLINFDF